MLAESRRECFPYFYLGLKGECYITFALVKAGIARHKCSLKMPEVKRRNSSTWPTKAQSVKSN